MPKLRPLSFVALAQAADHSLTLPQITARFLSARVTVVQVTLRRPNASVEFADSSSAAFRLAEDAAASESAVAVASVFRVAEAADFARVAEGYWERELSDGRFGENLYWRLISSIIGCCPLLQENVKRCSKTYSFQVSRGLTINEMNASVYRVTSESGLRNTLDRAGLGPESSV